MNRAAALIVVMGGPGDTTPPTVVITCAQTGPTATSPLNFTVTFSEEVTGFAAGDITIGGVGGAVANFATADNIVFTFNSTPTGIGTVTVDIAAGVCTDAAGNDNTAATQYSIVSITGVVADHDFANIATLFQDAARTTAVTADGNPIGGVTDLSGSNNHLALVAEATRPLYKINIQNGKPAAYFDGTGKVLRTGALTLNQPNTRFLVVKSNVADSSRAFIDGGADAQALVRYESIPAMNWSMYAGANYRKATPAPDTNWHVLTAIFNGASSALRVDGASLGTGNPGASNATGITYGKWYAAASNLLNGYVGRGLHFSGTLTDAQIGAIESALGTQWGISVLPFP